MVNASSPYVARQDPRAVYPFGSANGRPRDLCPEVGSLVKGNSDSNALVIAESNLEIMDCVRNRTGLAPLFGDCWQNLRYKTIQNLGG